MTVQRPNLIAAIICALLISVFGITSWSATSTKSPTFDEPYHAAAAWTQLYYHDYRIDAADPPLWMYWAALATPKSSLHADFTSERWTSIPQQMQRQWWWCGKLLFGTRSNDGDAFISHQRAMMLVMSLLLGGLIAWWAGKIGGAVAAIAATTLFAFDPNFLAHSSLMKNDVVFTLATAGLGYSLWLTGLRATWLRILAVALSASAMLTIKFSGVLALPIVAVMLLIRAFGNSWFVMGREIVTAGRRCIAAFAFVLFVGIFCFVFIWAAYGFRYRPTPDPNISLNMVVLRDMAAVNEWMSANGGVQPTTAQMSEVSASFRIRAILLADQWHVLPQAWLAGMLFTYQSALIRPCYLLGHLSRVGWWYYFPVAMLVKTPVATQALILITAIVGFRAIAKRKLTTYWTLFSIIIPLAIYMISAMRSNLNIGIRHIFPVYPFLFIAGGWMVGQLWNLRSRVTKGLLAGCLVLLMVESRATYPDYIPFFNVFVGGLENGRHVLSDSNVDWGQDLKSLAEWQKKHPSTTLYLSYFGFAHPTYYDVKYIPLPGGYMYDENPHYPSPGESAVVAVSASHLAGLFESPQVYNQFYRPLSKQVPDEIIGGSICLFKWPIESKP